MKKPLVLIVDDHPMMRETLISVFKWEPIDTIAASNGQEALLQLRRNKPDIVILDMEMPGGMSGIEVLQEVRKDPALSSTPIILHTSEAGASNLEEAQEADLILLKPADPDDLIMFVNRLTGPAPAKNG
jgi:chemosensory pili system protein ChpA (sensor histidine kinase/response regulator)